MKYVVCDGTAKKDKIETSYLKPNSSENAFKPIKNDFETPKKSLFLCSTHTKFFFHV